MENGVDNETVSADKDFSDNGTTMNLRTDSQTIPASRFSDSGSRSILEHMQMSSNLGKSPFSNPRSLMSTLPMNRGGNFPLKGQYLSQSARLSPSGNTMHSAHLMRGSGLSHSGSFNHSLVDGLFRGGERVVKTPPGFPPRKISLNQSASGNLFASSELYSHQMDFNNATGPSTQKSDVANLSGRW